MKLSGGELGNSGNRNYDDLPENCKHYVDEIERMINVPITLVSNGPKREQILHRESKLV